MVLFRSPTVRRMCKGRMHRRRMLRQRIWEYQNRKSSDLRRWKCCVELMSVGIVRSECRRGGPTAWHDLRRWKDCVELMSVGIARG